LKTGEIAAGTAIALAGLFFAVQTWALPDPPGYAQVGPRLFPALVAAGLLITGTLLAWQGARRGFPNMPHEEREAPDLRSVGWISGGILGHMALIGITGFVAASTLLFVCVARGYGSTRLLRDLVTGLALAVVLYLIFTQALGLSLGPMPGFSAPGR
jgi:putative tricarboxylic transport membrane protein